MVAFEQYLLDRAAMPAGTVVVGDVNSTLACALVSAKLHNPVAHVEAGLRSFDRTMPEEINRVATDAISDLLLVSEPAGIENLRNEGIEDDRVEYVGNVMIDTLVVQRAAARKLNPLEPLGLRPLEYALATFHRPTNVDDPGRLRELVAFLERLAARIAVVFPAHPRTRARLEAAGLLDRLAGTTGLRLIGPLGYRENLGLMERARLVVSDSGGIQEETTFLNVPCVTVRPNTERPITVLAGTNTVEEDLDRAWAVVSRILGRGLPVAGRTGARGIDGWDGAAASRIVDALARNWSLSSTSTDFLAVAQACGHSRRESAS